MTMAIHSIERNIWKRLGLAGFVFFLVKGLAWLIVPVLLAWLGYTS